MKLLKPFSIALLIAASLFFVLPAKGAKNLLLDQKQGSMLYDLSDLFGDLFSGTVNSASGSHAPGIGNTKLPIYNNILFLVIAASAIGFKVIYYKKTTGQTTG